MIKQTTAAAILIAMLTYASVSHANIPQHQANVERSLAVEKTILDTTPVMTIRFNQKLEETNQASSFKPTLEKMIDKTHSIKTNVWYDVVARVATRPGDPALKAEASKNMQDVYYTMTNAGVPSEHIAVHYKEDPTATTNTIQVYIH